MARDLRFDVLDDLLELPPAVSSSQVEVNVECVNAFLSRDGDDAVKSSPHFKPVARHRQIGVALRFDCEFAERGVSVVAFGEDRILSVGMGRPKGVCQEFELGLLGPRWDSFLMLRVLADHFLKQDKIQIERFETLFHFVQNELLPQGVKAFVNVVRKNSKSHSQYLKM